ncbi:MAG TPA: hypothetical protein VJM74_00905 [Nitrososphaeraceae archaeon]|nr:hypothetical protein [Nitrososphaeraceae archaeon]
MQPICAQRNTIKSFVHISLILNRHEQKPSINDNNIGKTKDNGRC